MNETPLQKSYADLLDTLSIAARQHWAWSSPEAGFSSYFLAAIGEPDISVVKANANYDDSLAHAPSLAFLGYELACQRGAHRREEWLAGLDRLQARNAFPADRQSFAYRPLEVLGIAVGIRACNLQAGELGNWIKSILTRTRGQQTSTWTAALQHAAELAVGVPGARSPQIDDARNLLDLCAVRWLLQISGANDNQSLDAKILEAAATEQWLPLDVAQAIVAHQMLRAAVRRSIHAEVERNWTRGRENQSAEALVIHICRRFHRMAQQLSSRHGKRKTLVIGDEYDVQDLMHAILVLFFDDVRPETYTPNYAGNSSRTDFVLWNERIVIEAKMTRKTLSQSQVANQLIVDKARYAADPRCGALVCFVYDPDGFCENPEALENDLAGDNNPRTRVVVHSSRL